MLPPGRVLPSREDTPDESLNPSLTTAVRYGSLSTKFNAMGVFLSGNDSFSSALNLASVSGLSRRWKCTTANVLALVSEPAPITDNPSLQILFAVLSSGGKPL